MDAVKRVEAGFGVPYICREMGISTATFYNGREGAGQNGEPNMAVWTFSMLSQMKVLEEENRRLNKFTGDRFLPIRSY